MSGDRLKTPPLIEALCELRFTAASTWDWTHPGRLYDLIGTEYSERQEVQRVQVRMAPSPSNSMETSVSSGPERIQLKRKDGASIVQLGPHLLSVNVLHYDTWEDMRALVFRILGSYRAISETLALQRIGLRFINMVPLAEPSHLRDVLTVAPALRGSLDRPIRSIYQRVELEQDAPAGLLIHQTGLGLTAAGKRSALVDLDFTSDRELPNVADDAGLARWLDAAHGVVEAAFIASLSDETYLRLRSGEAS